MNAVPDVDLVNVVPRNHKLHLHWQKFQSNNDYNDSCR